MTNYKYTVEYDDDAMAYAWMSSHSVGTFSIPLEFCLSFLIAYTIKYPVEIDDWFIHWFIRSRMIFVNPSATDAEIEEALNNARLQARTLRW